MTQESMKIEISKVPNRKESLELTGRSAIAFSECRPVMLS